MVKKFTMRIVLWNMMEPVKVIKPVSVRRAKLRVTAAVVAAIAVSTAVYLATASDTKATVNITSISLHIGYGSATDSYFGSDVQNITSNYETYAAGSTVSFDLSFHNSGSSSHTITAIFGKTSGFLITSEKPTLPVTIDAGHAGHVTISIRLPSSDYAGTLTLIAVVE